MRNFWKPLALAICFLGLVTTGSANAQLQIDLGSDDQVFRILQSAGYSNPVVTKRSLTIIRTEACKGGKKYRLKVSILGRITSRSEIGTCKTRQQVAGYSERQVRQALKSNRYTNIETRGARGGIQAIACRNGRKFEIFFNRQGKVVTRNNLGSCAPKKLSNDQIIQSLRTAGYRRIEVIESSPSRYLAEACGDSKKYRLRLNNRAEVENRRLIGNCRRAFSADGIAGLLRERGYTKVQITQRNSPPYQALACRNNDKYEVTIGRRGRIRNEKIIGTCRERFDARTLSQLMQQRGYDRINIVRSNRAPYIAEGCKGDVLQEIQVGQFGKVLREYRIGKCGRPLTRDALATLISKAGRVIVRLDKTRDGWASQECRQDKKVLVSYDPYGTQTNIRADGNCRSETVLNVLRTLESRGARRVQAFVEGCFDGGKFRWSFDRLGNRTDRTRVGSC